MEHDCYKNIIGNIFGWKCDICDKRLKHLEVYKKAIEGKYDN